MGHNGENAINFSSPSKVVDTIRASDETEQIRAENRVKVNNSINGAPPLTPEQAKKLGVKLNVNWGEMAVTCAHARRQYDDAILGSQNFFKISIPLAPDENREDWAIFITNSINRIMKRSEEYACEKESQFSAVVSHGIGPLLWCDQDTWKPSFVGLEDFRVPTDTKTSLSNLSWLAVRNLYTEGELSRKVFGRYSGPGWKKDSIKKILKEYHNTNYETTNYDWINSPEKMAELVKQNAGFYSSDAVPTIPLWHFYYMDDSNPMRPRIMLRVVPDLGIRGTYQDREFLYETEKPHCYKWNELTNIQFGDLNNKAPFLYHSVRSLGFLLMEPCFWTNLFRCRLLQHGMESLNIWLRINDPDGRARAQKVELFDKGIVPEGVQIVPQDERHQISDGLVEGIMGQLKQLISEASQSYTQQLDTGTQKEQTAFETRAKIAAVNAMMSGLLGRAFRKQVFEYREICRRFCLRNSSDPDVQEFQQQCKENGIPKIWLNSEFWEVEPEKPIGSGNPTMAEAAVKDLMEARAAYPPQAQQEILHEFTAVLTKDPRRAQRWVPLDGKSSVSDAQRDAEFAFGTMMQGVPVRMKPGLNPIEQIETFLGLLSGVMAQIEKNGNMADAREITGLQTVENYTNQLINQLAQDKQQKPRAQEYAKSLGKLANYTKAFAQRLQEQQPQGGDPEAAAKVQAMTLQAQTKSKVTEASAQQKMAHKEKAFEAEQRRKNLATVAEVGRQSLKQKHANNGDAFQP